MVRTLPVVVCPPAGPVPPPQAPRERLDQLADVFKALGDPVRLRLFTIIASAAEPVCVCNIPDVGVSQPTVSHHLRKLREAGLVTCERRGTWVHYRVTDAGRRHARTIEHLTT